MKIKKIRLSNGYKRFQDTTIDLGENPPRIVALVGSNGCGKSSVFDGMLFLQNAHDTIGAGQGRGNEYHSMHAEQRVTHSDINIEFDKGVFQTVFIEKQEKKLQKTIFSFRSPYRYNNALKVTETKATQEINLNGYGASSASVIDQKMEENYRRLSARYNKYLEQMDCKPSEAKAHIISELNKSIENCLEIRVKSLGNVEGNRGSIYFVKYDQDKEFEFDVLSSGEKEVVDILLDLYLRKEDYVDTVFLIDEPELHISTSIQKKLLLEIDKMVGADCQIWVATHSIGLLRALQDELRDRCEVIYFEPGTKFATEIQTLTPMPKTHANWRRVFATALDDLSGLVSPRTIIYCEGADRPKAGRENGFDATVYNSVFGSEFPDVLFVSSGGNTELDQRSDIAIMILSKVFSDLQVLVLKDRDSGSGKPFTQADRNDYLKSNPSNHRMLERWEIENYLYDEELLKQYCSNQETLFDQPQYKSLVADICDQNVKDEAQKMKLICGVSENKSTLKFKLDIAKYIVPGTTVYSELRRVIFPDLQQKVTANKG